jgi:probable rRNA maturation factor
LIDFTNKTGNKIDIKLCEKILTDLSNDDIELLLVDKNEIQSLNKEYRGIDKPTDVISFPFEKVPNSPIGSIVINIDKVIEKSAELGHSENEEFALLFLHGLLHILGYDHEKDNGQMRAKEREIIEKFSLPKSLIVRSE